MDELRRRSRWMMRALEWDEPRARYPNLWHRGMPRHIMAFDSVVSRLRLGDLIAIYHPTSKRRAERSNRFIGIARVVGLRTADAEGFGWIDLKTVHRFAQPLAAEQPPRRVFMCCDPGWPEQDVALFRYVFDAAVKAGWRPEPGDVEEEGKTAEAAPVEEGPPPEPKPPAPVAVEHEPMHPITVPTGRLFGGVDYSGDMRDPRDATWLAIVEHRGEALHLVRLEPTGRQGLQDHLRNPDSILMKVEAFGLDFPFGLPVPFAERILEGPFPDEGWWALARRFEHISRPDYLVAIQEFRDAEGEPRRTTDEKASAFSPLHRVNPDLGPMTYHGIRMIAEERSRYAVKPFESAQGRLLMEVYPGALVRKLDLGADGRGRERTRAILDALEGLEQFPVHVDARLKPMCISKRDAVDAVIAARAAAVAVLTGEAEKAVDELAPEDADRVRLEGWIYGTAV